MSDEITMRLGAALHNGRACTAGESLASKHAGSHASSNQAELMHLL